MCNFTPYCIFVEIVCHSVADAAVGCSAPRLLAAGGVLMPNPKQCPNINECSCDSRHVECFACLSPLASVNVICFVFLFLFSFAFRRGRFDSIVFEKIFVT